MQSSTRFLQYVTYKGLLVESPMVLVDVGASGGIDPKWHLFGDHFHAVGFDPLVKECERLNQESDEKIKYVASFVGAGPDVQLPDKKAYNNTPFDRLSVTLANKIMKTNANERYNSFQDVVLSENHITLDDYFKTAINTMDSMGFLKIDTDGHDIEVLLGATRLLKKNHFLGICVESQFHGANHPQANTFANIDIFLRENGFTLFDLECYRYSRKDLPGKFLISIPAQTDTGQIQWADAYYFRDLGNVNYSQKWDYNFTNNDILKLACLYELHNLHDCAVELVSVHQKRLDIVFDIDYAIELLTPPIDGKVATPSDYQNRFAMSIEEMLFLQECDIKRLSAIHKTDLQKFKKILYFGAGGCLQTGFSELQACFSPKAEIVIADNDTGKWGKTFLSKPVISPDEISNYRPEVVVIVSTYAQEILHQLLRLRENSGLDFKIFKY